MGLVDLPPGKQDESPHACGEEAVNRRALVLVVLSGLLLNPLQAVSWAHKADKVTLVKMEDDPNHGMVAVSCRIEGARRRYVCVIDSGATNTVVSDRVLEAQGPVVGMITANGVVRGHQREASLIIGEGLGVKLNAFVQSMLPEDVDIIVGQDVLRQFRTVVFDYGMRQVEFHR
jgi:hypothetical protein